MAESKKLTDSTYVQVTNGSAGRLIYKSPHSGEVFIWDEPGDTQDVQLRELKSAKSSSKKFFQNNWFMFDDPNVIEYLGLQNFYKDTLDFYSIDTFFEKDVNDMKKVLGTIPAAQRETLKLMARQKVKLGEIDSLSTIGALEEMLDIKLIEQVDE